MSITSTARELACIQRIEDGVGPAVAQAPGEVCAQGVGAHRGTKGLRGNHLPPVRTCNEASQAQRFPLQLTKSAER
jgi:hypothetical protein